MAAPSPTARVAPTGIMLQDGYSTKIAFSRDTNFSIWERTVKPPGIDGMDQIDISTMHNVEWKTFAPRNLKQLSECTIVAGLDPTARTDAINNLLNQEGTVTCHYPDGTSDAFYGYLKSMEPNEHSEGSLPEVTCTIVPTQWDVTNRVEAGPVLTAVSGT